MLIVADGVIHIYATVRRKILSSSIRTNQSSLVTRTKFSQQLHILRVKPHAERKEKRRQRDQQSAKLHGIKLAWLSGSKDSIFGLHLPNGHWTRFSASNAVVKAKIIIVIQLQYAGNEKNCSEINVIYVL